MTPPTDEELCELYASATNEHDETWVWPEGLRAVANAMLERAAVRCDDIARAAWARWKQHADMRDHGISDGAEMCGVEIRKGKAG
jgi:hypothetical protein